MRSCCMNPNNSTATLECSPPSIGRHNPVRRWRLSDAAPVIAVLVMLAVTTTMFVPMRRGVGLNAFTFKHIGFFRMVETSTQPLAHRVGLVLLAALCVLETATITCPAAHPPVVTTALRIAGEFLGKWCGIFIAIAGGQSLNPTPVRADAPAGLGAASADWLTGDSCRGQYGRREGAKGEGCPRKCRRRRAISRS